MTAPESDVFRMAVWRLHRAKDAAYRDAWKKRGEVMSIMANLARKVDRLEYVSAGAPVTRDESLFDTVVDLLVYGLKYQTYLADQSGAVADTLFGGSGLARPYSDGLNGFEALLNYLDLTSFDAADGPDPARATRRVLTSFADLETCFEGRQASVSRRSECTVVLTQAVVTLLGVLRREAPEPYRAFLTTYSGKTA